MAENLPVFDDNQRRIKRHRQVIGDSRNGFEIISEYTTEVTPNGNVETVETRSAGLVNGEAIWDINQISGRCQYQECNTWLTARTFRSCNKCGFVMCLDCSYWDEKQQLWLCKKCRKILRRKRIFKTIGNIITSPFRSK